MNCKDDAPEGSISRTYVSERRAKAAAGRRSDIVEAAAEMLRQERGVAEFTLDAVARLAGVTRLTVYNQFGSRRGLLETVFGHLAEKGGIGRLAEATASPNPLQALDRLVRVFCEFWTSDSAIARIYEAMATDPEIADALRVRIERGRSFINQIVDSALPGLEQARREDAADLVCILTDLPSVIHLRAAREIDEVVTVLQQACRRLLEKTAAS